MRRGCDGTDCFSQASILAGPFAGAVWRDPLAIGSGKRKPMAAYRFGGLEGPLLPGLIRGGLMSMIG